MSKKPYVRVAKARSTKVQTSTPQTKPIPHAQIPQVSNSAGGYVWDVGPWMRLRRFLILGSEGGTYYVSEKKLTVDNVKCLEECLTMDGKRAVQLIVEVSDLGIAPKNDPAIFALAVAVSKGNEETKKWALSNLARVCRIPTHLFSFVEYIDKMRGWGPSVKKAVSKWYLNQPIEKLAVQVLKYKQRNGWSHVDVLRLAHPKTEVTSPYNALFRRLTKPDVMINREVERKVKKSGKWKPLTTHRYPGVDVKLVPEIFDVVESLTSAPSAKTIVKAIEKYPQITWEMIPTNFLAESSVWSALLQNMPMTAMVRNLGRMTANGTLKHMSDEVRLVIEKLSDETVIRKSRIHPIQMLIALLTYESGHGVRGSLTWSPIGSIVDALDDAFYVAFKNVEPSEKRVLFGVDVSGSMTAGTVAGVIGLTPNICAAALAMVNVRVEKPGLTHIMGFADEFRDLGITAKDRLSTAVRKTQDESFGSTDCSLPIAWARKNKVDVDAFVVLTDSETYAGRSHPKQELDRYRKEFVENARLVVVGMTATEFSINDPADPLGLDVVGFDSSAPRLISDFIAGRV